MKNLFQFSLKLSSALSLLLFGLAVMTPPAHSEQGPMAQLEQTVNQVIEILKADSVRGDEQKKQLTSLVRERFDFGTMSQYVLGPQWRKTSPADREQFIALFKDLLEENYLGKIESYNDEKVSFISEHIDGERAQVQSDVMTGSTDIPIEYRLLKSEQGWRVYDVIIEGVSLVRTYRDNYREIVLKDGMAGLLERMKAKLSEIQQQGKTG